ncbi:MAG TPA: methylmalonyl Co-A mutase-associated GTPase MeaB [Bacteroidales bacterium]|nr:methylmalonyl Co-A mutase-associated GTPase MeaB [Bacteroidales bacterium]
MNKDKKPFESALKVQQGIEQPSQTNEEAIRKMAGKKSKIPSFDELHEGILSGNRVLLSRAITLIESSKHDHQALAQALIEKCLPHSGNSIRIGITGVPGVGKSTFIESFGNHLTAIGKKVAVLAIDPSSQISKGSILGDKTRMEKLSSNPDAFIRPSPSAGTLGGVAQKTRESIVLCEAAGFDIIIVETVGVGQSETAARSMVDFFLLLQLPGAGDELQGIKRGIMEMADAIFVNKAEGDYLNKAKIAAAEIKNALHLMPAHQSGWITQVGLCAALSGKGIGEVWDTILDYISLAKNTGYFDKFRHEQEVNRYHQAIMEMLQSDFLGSSDVRHLNTDLEKKVFASALSPYNAAKQIVSKFYETLK